MTSPNSKGVVGVVVRVVPDFCEGGRTHGRNGARERAVLGTRRDEIHKILDLFDTLRRQCEKWADGLTEDLLKG
jgi:hypothetical protein